MVLRSYAEPDSGKKRNVSVKDQNKALDRLWALIPHKEDGKIDAYKLGQKVKNLIDESKKVYNDPLVTISDLDSDVVNFFTKKKLQEIVSNPKSMEQSFIAQFILGSGLLPEIMEGLNG